jgi:hypothetical protein
MSSAVINPDNYLSEAEVLTRWPMLTAKELRKARKNGLITFYNFRGGPHCTPEQVQDYIDRTYLKGGDQCVDRSHGPTQQSPQPPPARSHLKSADTISTGHTPTGAASSMLAGMTPELVASGAELLKQRIGQKRK